MSWSADDIPDLTDRIAVVTGANGGLGLASTKALAAKGAHVVMAARNQDKARAAFDEVRDETPAASLEIVELDLGSQASTERAAEEIASKHSSVDILMNNAGLMAMPERRTSDGFEMQLGVNHFGHWTLTAGLLPSLLAAESARVVTVTSTAHLMGRAIDPNDINMEESYSPWGAYGRAKLANFHFGIGLQRRFASAGVAAESLVAHPGMSHTNLQVHTVEEGGTGFSGRFFQWFAATTGMDPDRGALSQLRAATDPDANGGEFYGPLFVNNGPPVRKPILRPRLDRDIATLWTVSEQATGVSLNI